MHSDRKKDVSGNYLKMKKEIEKIQLNLPRNPYFPIKPNNQLFKNQSPVFDILGENPVT